MPITNGVNPAFISVDGAGRANAGGAVEVYLANGTFTTLATIYSDQVKTTTIANPITLSDAGTAEFWYEVKVDIREKTKAGAVIRDSENLDPNANNAVVQGFNLAQNGSFEIDALNDGQPDNWIVTPYVGSAVAITSAVVTDGKNALEFNTTAAGSGGGTATSAKFPVTEGSTISVTFSFYATNATTTNTFSINWYDENDVLKSTSVVTMPASGSVPIVWTNYQEVINVDAAATQGEIVLVGIASGGSNLSSKAYFDGISVLNNSNIVTLTGTQAITGIKTLTSPVINTPTITANSESITSGGSPVYGLVVLDTPENMVNDNATASVNWTTKSYSTLTSNSAVKAIIRVNSFLENTLTAKVDGSQIIAIDKQGNTGSVFASVLQIIDTRATNDSSGTNSARAADSSEITVNLSATSTFQYLISRANLSNSTVNIDLVGYYV